MESTRSTRSRGVGNSEAVEVRGFHIHGGGAEVHGEAVSPYEGDEAAELLEIRKCDRADGVHSLRPELATEHNNVDVRGFEFQRQACGVEDD